MPVDAARGDLSGGAAAPPPRPFGANGSAPPPPPGGSPDMSGVPPLPGHHQARANVPPKPSVQGFIDEIRAAFGARFQLFELEAKRAAWSAAYMLAFAVGAALLGVTAWLILIGALIAGAHAAGVPWGWAVVVAIALHGGAVFFLLKGIRGMVENLTFAATRRTLTNTDSTKVAHGSGA